jgi:hypothetical protein
LSDSQSNMHLGNKTVSVSGSIDPVPPVSILPN